MRKRRIQNIIATLAQFRDDEDGAALIEYTVLIGLMLVGVLATITLVGAWVGGQWTALQTAV
jgi:pilus assembly protein Flp/PilA